MNQQNVEECGQTKFSIGHVEGVGAVLHIPRNERIEVLGRNKRGVNPKHSSVDESGDQPCSKACGSEGFEGGRSGWTRFGVCPKQKKPCGWSPHQKPNAVARFHPFEVCGAGADEVLCDDPCSSDDTQDEACAKEKGSGHVRANSALKGDMVSASW